MLYDNTTDSLLFRGK